MTKEEFNNKKKLYHYTTFESGLKILISQKLLFGKLKDMNDINESYRNIFYGQGISEDDIKKELFKYRQCSLTMDDSPRNGYYIPAMWGHYAERGNGICLVFDEKKLLSNLPSNVYGEKIAYNDSNNHSIVVDKDIEKFFEENKEPLFFTKTNDWEYEQEYRILTKVEENAPTYLNLNDSIMAVILYSARDVDWGESIWSSLNYEILHKMEPNLSILGMGYWFEDICLQDSSGKSWLNSEPMKLDI
jgi:hypothetical protein